MNFTFFSSLILIVSLGGCAAPYLPISAYPPTPDVHVANRACVHEMLAETEGANYFGLAGGLAAMPERDAIYDSCMRSHGYAQR
jgi:hypothetical protein